MQGSRSGGIIASAWATLVHVGAKGYEHMAERTVRLWRRCIEEIPRLPGLRLVTPPDASVVSFTSDDFSILTLASKMEEFGWEMPKLSGEACRGQTVL